MRNLLVYLAKLLAITGTYAGAGWLAGFLRLGEGSAIVVWPSAGLALAVVLTRGGFALAPGVFLGSVAAGVVMSGNVGTAVIMATFNTVGAVLAGIGLRRVEFAPRVDRLRDVLHLIVWALASGAITASGGALAAQLAHRPGQRFFIWMVWVLGDAIGVLLVTPVLLVWWHDRPRSERLGTGQRVELGVVSLFLPVANLFIFTMPPHPIAASAMHVLFPLLLWAAVRFGQRGAATALMVTAIFAMLGTAQGLGPFHGGDRVDRLLSLQLFLGIVVVTALILGAVIEERREAIGLREDFLFVASHELKTPLAGLLLAVQNLARMLRRAPTPLAPPVECKLNTCHVQIERLHGLVDELLDVSRVSGRKMFLRREPVDLASIARAALRRLHPRAEQAGCAVEAVVTGATWGQWDAVRLEQVVGNLLGNAIKYGAGKPICVRVEGDSGVARVRIEDAGIGIAAHDTRRIFNRFERAVSSHYYGGLGIGLHLAREIVEAHGGRIVVHSKVGCGSTFTVELPKSATTCSVSMLSQVNSTNDTWLPRPDSNQ